MVGEVIDVVSEPVDTARLTGCGPLTPMRPATDAVPLRQQVFDAVRAHGRVSRAEAARLLGVSPASVTAATTELIAAGVVEEIEAPRDGDTGRGRPPVALAVRPDAGYVAGVKMANAFHTAVILDFAGGLVAEASIPAPDHRIAPDALLDEAARLLDVALDRAGLDRSVLLGVGLGLPGFIDSAHGLVHWSPIMTVEGFALRDAAARHLGLPVHLDNDANLVTLAELWFGDGRGVSNFAVVTIEHGIGMGLVLNNRLFRGSRGIGTELGHTKVQLDGALCRCGQRGCLEAYVADYALVREASTALDWSPLDGIAPAVLLEQLYAEAKAGNKAARSIFRRAGRYLAVGIANVINLFDPDVVILSGERMRYDYLYADEVMAELESAAIRADRPVPRVEIHAWGDLIWARGAAALALAEATPDRLTATLEAAT
ncbi:ROK family transcriptional regulator [Mesobaculum littorinae]|uniref:ROK family transcriptional regulator n=1 Tax=Mesobaculum littorinae TaxID=2486419 RepID=A0A438AE96_9RHOB|nr:ROK family transcriptional regulator [Mesobaculum littorinae]RVV97009.1 ROK family transcriptional regulator [Mesobaculum littorinae]